MKKPWSYHGECCALGGPAAKILGASGPSGFGLGTSLGTTFTMIPPRLFQIMSHSLYYQPPKVLLIALKALAAGSKWVSGGKMCPGGL